MRGFISEDLEAAFTEAYAISQGTKCKQFLFSLSLNPPETEKVPIDVFEQAIAAIESRLGLDKQPRAIVFHEKGCRKHAHCVWSRIDIDAMKAINLPHYKMKLHDIARDLFLEHDWKIPNGFLKKEEKNPLNFSLAEWQQAKRTKQDPRFLKALVQDCWNASDSAQSFSNALQERGFFLAKGDRRGHVIVSWRGEVFSVARTIGAKTNDVAAKLGSNEKSPSVADVQRHLSQTVATKIQKFAERTDDANDKARAALDAKRRLLVNELRAERRNLKRFQSERRIEETQARSQRMPSGIIALWFRITGIYDAIKKKNEAEAGASKSRDRLEIQRLVEKQLFERRRLQHQYQMLRQHHAIHLKKLNRELRECFDLSQSNTDEARRRKLEPPKALRPKKYLRSCI